MAGLLLGKGNESAADGCSHTHELLQAPNWQSVDSVEWQAIPCGCVLELLRGDFTRLQQTNDFVGGFLDGGVEGGDPVLDLWVIPTLGDIILQCWVWGLQDIGEGWRFWWRWSGCMGWGGRCGRAVGALDWGEWVAQVLELLACAGQFVSGVLEGAQSGAFRRCRRVSL